MTNPTWKPHPGKPAMTRDGRTLVTDLERMAGRVYDFLWSPKLKTSWYRSGESTLVSSLDLIKPTAEILAAHGIDADGKPVADPPGTFSDGGKSWEPDAPAPSTRVDDRWFQAACAALTGVIAVEGVYDTLVADICDVADRLMAEVSKREGR